jgi:chemotaxis response regulator CheB
MINTFFMFAPLQCGFVDESSIWNLLSRGAIGVVLSGTASDGARGLAAIKEAGGVTFAEDPESAQYDGMPRAAIATVAFDRGPFGDLANRHTGSPR